ncbi:hypothetical protein GCM10010276_33800 [Streptomyces longisporus]|uniref:Uncharacterized protein n=1 Tax=Streptomyces longisporus TaxID=1948 RepID=A0ABN3LWE9_STRLO
MQGAGNIILLRFGGHPLKSGSGPDLEKWPPRVAAARRSGRIPETKELYGSRCRGGYEIKLVDIPAWRLAVLDPSPCPRGSRGRPPSSGPCRTNASRPA